MITIKNPQEIKTLREGGKRLAFILETLANAIRPGVSAAHIDTMAHSLATEKGDTPSFLDYTPDGARHPYPASICISINDEVVHGIPTAEKIFRGGDIVTIDMGLIHGNLFTDSAVTLFVEHDSAGGDSVANTSADKAADKAAKKLIATTKKALEAGIKAAQAGAHVGDIGNAIEQFVKPYNYGHAEGLAGHGVGYAVHEDPYVPNTGKPGEGPLLKPGMVIAIEPMLTEGSGKVIFEKDGYTVRTRDGKRAAQFEHTIAITEKGPVVLTRR